MEPSLLPIFLRLAGVRCLVVGGGAVAWSKARTLIEAGATVRMLAPRFDPSPADLAGHARLVLDSGRFAASALEGTRLVIAATDDPAVQREVRDEAERRGILCNVVDVPELCGFVFGATLRRGPLQIAVSTGGRAPLLAARLRDRLAARLPEAIGDAVEAVGAVRDHLRDVGSSTTRREALLRLIDEPLVDAVEQGDLPALHARIAAWKAEA